MLSLAKRLWTEEEGQGMAEYGLILALVAVVVMGTLLTMGESVRDKFTTISDKLEEEQE